MKVCFVIPTLTSGGAERVAVTVLSALDGDRFDRTLYLFSSAEAVYLDRVAPGVRVVVARRRRWLGRMLELSQFLHDTRPDVIMPFLSYFITAVAAALSGGHGRVVFNQGTPTSGFLDDADFQWRRPLRRLLFSIVTALFYRRADAVVATSEGVAEDLAANYGVPRSKIRVLHNPVDLEAIERQSAEPIPGELSQDRPVVAAAGRLAGVKNYPLLIAAFAELAKRTPAHLWILGEGPEQARLEALARERGVAQLVRFLGFQQNPWRYIARADVFALTSTYEGFGNVLIEAMACGTPVVATRSPGTLEIIGSDTGILVEHDAAAIANACDELLTNPEKRAAMVARARRGLAHYALPAVAARYDQLFHELAA